MEFDKIKTILKGPLPGESAHSIMAPTSRFTGNQLSNPADARPGSVLILFYRKGSEWFIPFIQRPIYDGVHSGQISLPGGKCEPGDKDMLFTALRETHEEIGIAPEEVNFLGALTPLYIPNSNFYVYPQVGWVKHSLFFTPDPLEVEEILEVPVSRLLDRKKVKYFTREIQGVTISAPYFDARGSEIWGATAMILSEMLEVIRGI